MAHALPEIPPEAYGPDATPLPEQWYPADAVPAPVRTWAYAAGCLLCLGVGPALLAVDQPALAGVADRKSVV